MRPQASQNQQSVSDFEDVEQRNRSALARLLALLALGVFLMGPILIALLLMTARAEGQLPPFAEWGPAFDESGYHKTRHGAWHGGPESNPGAAHLGLGFVYALAFPFLSLCAGVVSCLVRRNWLAGAVIVLCVLFDLAALILIFPLFA